MSVIEAPTVREVPSVSREVTTADVLNRAADLLEEWNWMQGSHGVSADGSLCMVGAVGAVVHTNGDPLRYLKRIVDEGVRFARSQVTESVYAALVWACGQPPSHWNDAPGRTKAEVVAKLREAARAA